MGRERMSQNIQHTQTCWAGVKAKDSRLFSALNQFTRFFVCVASQHALVFQRTGPRCFGIIAPAINKSLVELPSLHAANYIGCRELFCVQVTPKQIQ